MSESRVILNSLIAGALTAAGLTIGVLPGAAESTVIGADLHALLRAAGQTGPAVR